MLRIKKEECFYGLLSLLLSVISEFSLSRFNGIRPKNHGSTPLTFIKKKLKVSYATKEHLSSEGARRLFS